jgi:hypothetical protein
LPAETAGPAPIAALDLTAGTRILYAGVTTTILSGPEPAKDRFDRDMLAFHARREDTGAEGRIIFGPAGVALPAP